MAQTVKSFSLAGANQEGDGMAVVRPPVLVDCPECNTTFSVSRAALSQGGVEPAEPTFHCSRCDSLFSVPLAELREAKAPPAANRSVLSPNRLTQVGKAPSMPMAVNGPTQTSLFDLPPPAPKAPHTWSAESIQLKDVGFIKSSPLPDAPQQPGHVAPQHSAAERIAAAHAATKPNMPLPTPPMKNIRERSRQPATMWSLIVPVVSFLGVLGLMTGAIFAGGSMRDAVLWMLPQVDNSLSSSVVLRNVAFKTVTLDNGEQVRVVSGKMYNGTGTSLDRVDLEAAVFSKKGDEIASQRVSANSTVSKSKVKSLTVEMINEIQRGARARGLKLRPGEESAFSIIIPKAPGARFFTTRVYSAKAVEG